MIPGGKNPGQVADNAASSDLAMLDRGTREAIDAIYEDLIADHVHHRW